MGIKIVTVLGTGTMGPGIAQAFALAGLTVRLYSRSEESNLKGLNAVRDGLRTFKQHGLIQQSEEESGLARIEGVTTLENACRGADFLIEAIPEDLEIKRKIFLRLDQLCPPDAILASNTSGLSITAMGTATNRPDKVLGTHFWNPPNLIPLVEIVRGEKTSEETARQAAELMAFIGKKPVMVNREIPGFIGTRLHQALIREAFFIVDKGIASMEDVDTVVKTSFGRRLAVTGPFETCDLGGLDVFLAAAEIWKDLSNSLEPSILMTEKVEQGHLGIKTGKGLFDWDRDVVARILKERETELIHYLKKNPVGNIPKGETE